MFQAYAAADANTKKDSSKSRSEDEEARDVLGPRDKARKNSDSGESADRRAFSSIGHKLNDAQ